MSPTVEKVALVVLSAGLAFAAGWLVRRADAAGKQEKRLDVVEAQLAMMSQAVTPISAAMQAMLIAKLTHFHTPRMDSLLVKLGPPSLLSQAEVSELQRLLLEREQDMGDLIDGDERIAAHILLGVVQLAESEAAAIEANKSGPLALVVPPKPPEPLPNDAEPDRGSRA